MLTFRVCAFPVSEISPVTETLFLQLVTELGFHEFMGHAKSVRQECSTAESIIECINAGEGYSLNRLACVGHLMVVVEVCFQGRASFIKIGLESATVVSSANVFRSLLVHQYVNVWRELHHALGTSVGQIDDLLTSEDFLHLISQSIVS